MRLGRKSAFIAPKDLYFYKEDALYTFSSYRVIGSASEVSGETFAFIFDTLDGKAARSEYGVATIASVGNLLNEPQNASSFQLYDALGLATDQHYVCTAQILADRLVFVESLLAHQPTSYIPIPSTANGDLVEKADMFHLVAMPNVALMVVNLHSELTKKIEASYAANGSWKIQSVPVLLFPAMSTLHLLHLVGWNLDGFKPFQELCKNTELWHLMLRAQTEILRLPRLGWLGWLMSFLIGSLAVMQMNMPLTEGVKPVVYHDSIAFHYGRKVAKQDRRMLEEVLTEGEKEGKRWKC